VALTEALETKPNTYEAFERALIKAYKFSQENEDKTVDDVAAYIDIDKEFIRYEVYGGHGASHPDPDKAPTVTLHDNVIEFGYTTDYDIEPLYNTAIYKAALDTVVAENPGDPVYDSMLARFAENDQ
jgi:NitT/TauT family transport system substrate-binding protein